MTLRFVFRSLRARPAYTAVVLGTIALVVGPSAAVLGVINATVVRPLPYPEPQRLLRVFTLPPNVTGTANWNPLAPPDFVEFRAHATLVAEVAGQWARDRALGGDAEPETIPTSAVSGNFFRTLGAAPMRGRTFTDKEDRDDARLAVLSYGLWKRRFGGDEGVIGRRIMIDREDHVVIGIMPADFNPLYVRADLWTPLAITEGHLIQPGSTFVQSVIRMQPGVTPAQLGAQLSQLMQNVVHNAPGRARWTVTLATIRDAQFGTARPALMALLLAVVVLALTAVANLTNVTVAEVASRRTEVVLRAALGAGRRDLVVPWLVESVVLAVVGGGLGLLLGVWSLPALLSLDPATAKTIGAVPIDWRVQIAVAVLALAVSLMASVVPVLMATRGDVARGLAEGSRRTAGSRRGQRVRAALVAAETLFVAVLLACGALLVSAFQRTARTDPGFDPRHMLTAQLRLAASAYGSAESRVQLVTNIVDRLRATPGVTDVGTTLNPFVPGFFFITLVRIDGKPSPDGNPYTVQFRRATPGYFKAMRIPEIEGRTFDEHDTAQSAPVIVISRLFASQYWPGESAIGKRVQRGADPKAFFTVVGIVGDVSDGGFSQAPAPTMYVAFAQNNVVTAPIGLIVRTAGDPAAMASTVARVVHEVDPAQPIADVNTLEQFLSDSVGPDRFRGILLGVFAGVGLLLAAVGIYGVTSRGVAERTRELGVRLALGGRPNEVRVLVLGQALTGLGVGFVLGLPAAWLAGRLLVHWVPGVEAGSMGAVAIALGGLAAAGLISAGVPALLAGRIDPLSALRAD